MSEIVNPLKRRSDDVGEALGKTAVIEIRDLSFLYPGAETKALDRVSLRIRQGECVCLAGPSGCGKSTLLLAIAGLLKKGEMTGIQHLSRSNAHGPVGIVFQNAESQILATTVADEVAFGPMNVNLPEDEIFRRVRTALDAVGLSGYEKRNVEELSAGEKHRLTIAAVLSTRPSILLLDEPTAQLDATGKEALRSILEGLKKSSYTILVADHDIEPYEGLADRYLFMRRGTIVGGGENAPPVIRKRSGVRQKPAVDGSLGQSLLHFEDICFSRTTGREVIKNLSFEVYQGERIHVLGANGAGKSTFFKLATGLLKPDSGSLRILGLEHPRPESLRGKLGLLLQNPVRQLFEETVYDEVAFSLKRQNLSLEEIDHRTTEALDLCRVLHLRHRSPLTLSYGEKHRVTLASVIALGPTVMLLDEPFSGLDFDFRYSMLELLKTVGTGKGWTILIASHDPLVDDAWAHRTFRLEEGKLNEAAS